MPATATLQKPDQHYPRSVGDTDREEIRAHLRKAIREMEAIEASLPLVLLDGIQRQRDTAANYLDVTDRISETALDCLLNIAKITASLGNSTFDVKGCRDAIKDVLGDELFDARQWANETEEV